MSTATVEKPAQVAKSTPKNEKADKVTLPNKPGEMLKGDQIRLNMDDIWIDPNENIRNMENVTEEEIEQLAASIFGTGGLLQDLGVVKITPNERTLNRSYGLAYGFRRGAALKYLGEIHGDRWITEIPCKVISVRSLQEFRIAQLAENLQRSDLNAMEKAMALKSALDDKNSKLSQKDLASTVGLSDGNVSQLLALLKLPEEVQKMMQGIYRDAKGDLVSQTLSFSHARLILANVPPEKQVQAAKVGLTKTYTQFEKYITDKWINGDGEETEKDGEDTPSESQGQRSSRLLTSTDLEKSYIPFAMQKCKVSDQKEKKYTEHDVWKRVFDTLKTVQRDSGTAFAKEIAPFLKEQAKREEEERSKKDSEKVKDKWFKEKIKFINDLMDLPPDASGKRQWPELSDAMAPVVKQVMEFSDEIIEALGFPLEKDKFEEELMTAWTEDRKSKIEAKDKREKARLEKEAKEKADKEKAGKEGGTAVEEVLSPDA